ncbi:MAG TPA: thioredoxin domain-containing protein [Caulobacteraceae bacterium]|jgi:protein-disulfide isomerase|nr:thioredoxin domain-containing protein [Caulobacteraceae bacterium]
MASRRAALALGLSLALAGAAATAAPAPGPAGIMAPEPGDMAMGKPHARVTVIEYGSVGCPHCAVWANTVFPAFKAKFVDTGRVRFVVREMTTGESDLAAAGFILARCAGPTKYFQVVDEIYQRQASMFQPGATPIDILKDIGAHAGIVGPAFDACMRNDQALAALNARVQHHAEVDKIDSTPTFVINGKVILGEQSLDQMTADIAAARRH